MKEAEATRDALRVQSGTINVLRLFDVAYAIDLGRVEKLWTDHARSSSRARLSTTPAKAMTFAEAAEREAEAKRLAEEAAGIRPERKSECTLAHDFADAVAAKPWLELGEFQQRRLREWVIEQCRDPDAPVAEEATSL